METTQKIILAILDGWGHGPDPKVSAIAQADTPYMDSLYKHYPNSELITYGGEVGLPEGQMGNSEVGHLNIGAGRIVYQELARINKAITDGTFQQHPVLVEALQKAKANNKQVHLLGLVSDGGVHSHINHLKVLVDVCQAEGPASTYIHAFMDGRDTSPTGGVDYLKEVQAHLEGKNVRIASMIGRYYAMDRDKRWERVKKAYDLLVHGLGASTQNLQESLQASYNDGRTDEFILPHYVEENGQAIGTIEEGDLVICYNFRTDRCREITQVLSQEDMPEQGMSRLDLDYVTMTRYDESFEGVSVVFLKEDLQATLGEVLSKAGKTQVRIAETEKYPHVTFFFSGGREREFEGESRIMVPSPKVATYDLQPEMSAPEITSSIIQKIQADQPDFVCLNYANTDMVGHTGVFEAAKKADETVDALLKQLVETALNHDYGIVIIADHGNSDTMYNADGSAHTAHTMNPVPLIYVSSQGQAMNVADGKLADIAPSILSLMGIDLPSEMTGDIIIK
ncbi:MAG: 2,3-bisphosphoglycerate-independent phosphoglycerate mutase [Bacteroidota bacterium]